MWLNLKITIKSLARHKLRTILAMLGIFLGALAFTGVQHVSRIMVKSTEIEIQKMGPNLFAVMSGQVRFSRGGGIRFRGVSRTMTISDATAMARGTPSVLDYTPLTTWEDYVRAGGKAVQANVVGCWPSYQDIRAFYPEYGRFFTQEEDRGMAKVCVIGKDIAEKLWGGPDQAMGQPLFFYRATFEVIGVMEAKGRDLAGVNQDEQVFLPLSTFMHRASNQNWVQGVYFRLADGADMAVVKSSVTSILRERHHLDPGEDDDFSLMEPKDTIELQRQALDLMQTLGVITSTISFAVGGMGILSIMVLMVRMRRLEIGIRRAVGGKRADIVRQFVYEAALLSVTGAFGGVLLCVAGIVIFTRVAPYPLLLDPVLLVGTLAGAAVLGVASGAYPAWQASQVEILDVLRSE